MANEFTITINRFQYYTMLQAIETAACAIDEDRRCIGEPHYTNKGKQISEFLELKRQLEQLTGVKFEYVPALV